MFFARVKSLYSQMRWYHGYATSYLPRLDTITREVLNFPEMPPLQELVHKDSLMLLNAHFSDHYTKSLPPFVVQVGGMHLQDFHKPLSKDLEAFIQAGRKGFIYISFGSIIKISTEPPEFLQIFVKTIEDLKDYQFLWKWEGEKPKNIPSNVFMLPWFEQQDVLGHAKIRGFISQGGQISIQQAIHNGVPLILFPVDGDQSCNAKRLRKAGNGIEMKLHGLTSNSLRSVILKLVEDESFSKVSAELKKISRDRMVAPVDTAVWWTEYILRHENTRFLKPTVKPWWMMLSLDILGFFALLVFASIFFIVLILAFVARKIYKIFGKKVESNVNKRKIQ